MFLNSLLFCVISTVQWSGATSICDGIISSASIASETFLFAPYYDYYENRSDTWSSVQWSNDWIGLDLPFWPTKNTSDLVFLNVLDSYSYKESGSFVLSTFWSLMAFFDLLNADGFLNAFLLACLGVSFAARPKSNDISLQSTFPVDHWSFSSLFFFSISLYICSGAVHPGRASPCQAMMDINRYASMNEKRLLWVEVLQLRSLFGRSITGMVSQFLFFHTSRWTKLYPLNIFITYKNHLKMEFIWDT